MDHAVFMGFFQSLTDLDTVFQHLFCRQWSMNEAIGQGLTLQVFHNQKIRSVLAADVM